MNDESFSNIKSVGPRLKSQTDVVTIEGRQVLNPTIN